MFNTVIFDMDGVLVDSMPQHYEAWRQAFERENISVSRIEIYKREGEQGRSTAEEILLANGVEITDEKIKNILEYKEQIFKNIRNIKFFPGAEDLIKTLSQADVLLGLVTGTSRSEVDNLLSPDFRKMFHSIVTGTDVARGKPDPEPYNRARNELKSKSEEIIVVENAPNGIRSAKAAGLKCIALTTSLPGSFLSDADWIFDSIVDANRFVCNELCNL